MTRTELEKQILEILKKSIYKDGDIYVFYSKKALNERIIEIASLFEQKIEGWCGKEFVEWIVIEMQKGRLWHEDSDNTYNIFERDYDYTLDELHEYWKNLPENK
jgi:hypothetical protein